MEVANYHLVIWMSPCWVGWMHGWKDEWINKCGRKRPNFALFLVVVVVVVD